MFDGEYPLCSAAATALRRLSEVGVIAWNTDAAQQFLVVQFDEPPFTLVFGDITAAQMWLGRAAAGELCDRAGLPALVQDPVEDNVKHIADTVRVAVGSKCDPADLDGTRSFSGAATVEYRTLATNARSSQRTSESHYSVMEHTTYASL